MQKDSIVVRDNDIVSEIVNNDFRTADVFRSYGINFCSSKKVSLRQVCENKEIDLAELKNALIEKASSYTFFSPVEVDNWSIEFSMDFIINVHHAYLYKALPSVKKYVMEIGEEHQKQFPYHAELLSELEELIDFIIPGMKEEEDIVFPYIRQISHAYQNKEPYARLMVKTLRKPIAGMMLQNMEFANYKFREFRRLTNDYKTSAGACAMLHVLFKKLNELENDLYQHLNLENNFLYPRIIAVEKEILLQK